MQLEERLGVRWEVGVHRIDDAQFIRLLREIREQLADPEPTLPVLRKFPARAEQLGAGDAARLVGIGVQLRLVIESIHVRRRAAHAEKDDAFRPRGEMRGLDGERAGRRRRRPVGERTEGQPAEPAGERAQCVAAGEEMVGRVHGE